MKNGEAPQHIIRWSWADWMTSSVRTRSLVTGDRDLRLVYFELLNVLYSRGGEVEGDPAKLADLLGIPVAVVDKEMPVLLELDAIQMDKQTRILTNPRVSRELERTRSLSEVRRRAGRSAHEQMPTDGEQMPTNADKTLAKGNGKGTGNGNGLEEEVEDARRVFDYWREKTGHGRAVCTSVRMVKLRARLVEEPDGVAGLMRAVDGAVADPFFAGDNDRGKRYWDFDNVFRNRDRIEKLQESAKRYTPKMTPTEPRPKLPPHNNDAAALFEDVKGKLEKLIPDHSRRTWITPCDGWAFENEDTVLIVTCPSDEHVRWMRGVFKDKVKAALQEAAPGLLVRPVVREVTP